MFPFFARLTTCLINGSASCSSNCSANNVAWFRLPEGRPEMTSFICTILDLRPECVLVNPAGEKLGSNGSPCPSNPSTPIKAVPADGDNSSMEPAHNSDNSKKARAATAPSVARRQSVHRRTIGSSLRIPNRIDYLISDLKIGETLKNNNVWPPLFGRSEE